MEIKAQIQGQERTLHIKPKVKHTKRLLKHLSQIDEDDNDVVYKYLVEVLHELARELSGLSVEEYDELDTVTANQITDYIQKQALSNMDFQSALQKQQS